MTTLAVVNQKGGVGKTTSTINLGAALGALEKRVLLVDCDPQGNTTRGLGLVVEEPHLYHALSRLASPEEALRASGFPFMDVLPSGRDLVGIEVEFVGLAGWHQRLQELLAELAEGYDYVLIDCPPSLGHLTVMAAVAADSLLVPLQCEYFALEGISELMGTVRRIQGGWNRRLGVLGILLTMYDERTKLSKEVADEVRRHFPQKVFRTVIPRNVRLAEAPSHGIPVLQHDIKSRGAEAYLALAQEVLERTR